MPWQPSDTKRHNKRAAKTAKGRRTWSKVATKLLSEGKSEGSAIRIANSVADRLYGRKGRS